MIDQESPPRVVFDCGVFLQALISESGPAVACLELFERGAITLLFSEATLLEIKDVLSRSKLRAKYPRLTEERTKQLIESLWSKAEFVQNVPQHFSYERDPDDEPYLNLAIEAEASYLVSRDKDLLDLMTGYTEECKDFRRRFRPLKVVDPVTFLQQLEKNDPEESTS